MVWPTMSGVTLLLRAQVLMSRFSFLEFILLIFSSRFASMYGPFFEERVIPTPIYLLSFALAGGLWPAAASANNKALGPLVIAGAIALCRLAPGGLRLASTRGAAFATSMGVVAWVHSGSPRLRPPAEP